MDKFMIGADHWAGLSKIAEETGELGQVIGKLLGTQGESDHWDGTNLITRIEDEMADVLAAIDFTLRNNSQLDTRRVLDRRTAKVRQFQRWHEEVLAHRANGLARVTDYVSAEDKRDDGV